MILSQPILVKMSLLVIAYIAHGHPFAGTFDYGYALLAASLLFFGILRHRLKPVFVILGVGLLVLGRLTPQLAIPEYQRLLMDTQQNLIPPGQFLKDASKYPYFLTADGYLQGQKEKRFVPKIDIEKEGILSLRSGWVNRPEYNFYPQVSSYIRYNLPFVVCYEIIPQMVGMTLNLEGLMVFEREGRFKIHDPAVKTVRLEDTDVGSTLRGFGGQWDATGYHNLKINLEKTMLYKLHDTVRWGAFLSGFLLLFLGFFSIRFTLDFGLQSLLLFLSALSFWIDHPHVFRWGIFARGGMDGIIHGGFPYWMLEKWASGDWGTALMSPEAVFYFMPGMRYIRFGEMLLFGDSYILQACFLFFTPVIFYRFFSLFLSSTVVFPLSLLTFAYLCDGIGLSMKFYIKSLLDLHSDGFAYALLLVAITMLAKSIQKIGWGTFAFFLLAVSIAIRPNLLVFVGIIGAAHLFSTTFSLLPWSSRLVMLFGLAPLLLIPVHNILGGEFVLITKASAIKENLPLSPWLYVEGIEYLIGMKGSFDHTEKFIAHFRAFYPQYALAWIGCLWLSFKGQTPLEKSFAFATFASLSMHFFYLPDLRYLHLYLTIAIVLGFSQIPQLRRQREGM